MSKSLEVLAALLAGGALGALSGAIIGRFPPITLHPENPTDLDKSNQVFAVAGGIIIGEVAAGAIVLAE